MIKYKIGFTVTAEILFSMLAKFLPIDDLFVEEIAPIPPTPAKPKIAQQLARHIDRLPKRKRRPSKPLDLNVGINRVIMELLADGKPHRATELKPLLQKAGFSSNSAGSRLQNLQKHGIVRQMGDGTWTANLATAVSA